MKSIICVELNRLRDISFRSPLKDRLPVGNDLVFFDFDNHSDRLVVDYATKLLEETSLSVVIFKVNIPDASGSLVHFCEQLIKLKSRKKIFAVVCGTDQLLQKMLKPLGQEQVFFTNNADDALHRTVMLLGIKSP